MTITVLVVDDEPIVREGFSAVLAAHQDFDVLGTAADGAEAVALAAQLRPHVVLMDVRMPVVDGIEATRRITALAAPTPRVLVLTTFDLDDYVYDALRAGASGFLLKDTTAAKLVEAVQVVADGQALLSPSITRRLVADFAARRPHAPDRAALSALTPREREVLMLVAQGMTNSEIAGRLVLAEQTVKTHVGRIFAKLGLQGRAQAVVLAYETGLVVAGAADGAEPPTRGQ